MKIFSIIYIQLLLINVTLGQNWHWAKTSGQGGEAGIQLSSDNNGGIVVLATGENPMSGPFTAQCDIHTPNLLVRYDGSGQIVWQTGMSGLHAYDVACDKLGNSYIVGELTNAKFCSVTNQPYYSNHAGLQDAFIAKYNINGDLEWVRKWGNDSTRETVNVISVSLYGDIRVAGERHYKTNGGMTIVNHLFVSRFDSLGNNVWSTEANNSALGPFDVEVDSQGNCYLAAMLIGSAQFGTSLSSTQFAPVIAKLDQSGNIAWSKVITSNNDASLKQLKFDGKEYLYFIGDAKSGALFDGTSINSNGSYLAKYDTTGQLIWVTQSGAKDGRCLDINTNGEIICGEGFQGSITLSTTQGLITHTSAKTAEEILINKYDQSGGIQWSGAPGGSPGYRNRVNDVTCQGNSIYVTGEFCAQTFFGSNTLTCTQNHYYETDVFVAKLLDMPIITSTSAEVHNSDLVVIPNPTSAEIQILTTLADCQSIKVFNNLGQQLISSNIESAKTISLQNLPPGIYYIQIETTKSKFQRKVIKTQ